MTNEIGGLFRLQRLSFGNNSFQGEFPANLSHCVHLKCINVYNNFLMGNLPIVLASWSKLNLNRLILGENDFTGSILPSIGNLSSIEKKISPLQITFLVPSLTTDQQETN